MQIAELLQLDDFRAYRAAEIERGAEVLQGIWSADPQYVKGALDMLSKILRVPESLAKGDKAMEFVRAVTAKDFAEFEMKYLRKHLEVEE